jgi:hypothetical protein
VSDQDTIELSDLNPLDGGVAERNQFLQNPLQ